MAQQMGVTDCLTTPMITTEIMTRNMILEESISLWVTLRPLCCLRFLFKVAKSAKQLPNNCPVHIEMSGVSGLKKKKVVCL